MSNIDSLAFLSTKKSPDKIGSLAQFSIKCSTCNSTLSLIITISTHSTRILSIFKCFNCPNTFRILRLIKNNSKPQFHCNSNNLLTLGISKDVETNALVLPTHYMQFYDQLPEAPNPTASLKNLNSSDENDTWNDELYEKMTISGFTKTFKQFSFYVQQQPQQLIRYSWDSLPIFYSDDSISKKLSSNDPPPCSNCGSRRVFEFQFMPFLHSFINSQTSESTPKDSLFKNIQQEFNSKDWGTVLFYSCLQDCNDSSYNLFYNEEYVAVQLEND